MNSKCFLCETIIIFDMVADCFSADLDLKNVWGFFYVKEKDIWIEKFLFSFRFMKISREGGNYELFIRVRRQISPLILSEFKRIN